MSIRDFKINDPDVGVTLLRKTRAPTNPERHFHSSWELFYLVSGTREFFLSGSSFSVEAGAFFSVPPERIHRGINRTGVCDLFNIYFQDPRDPWFLSLLPLLEQLSTREGSVLTVPEDRSPGVTRRLVLAGREMAGRRTGYLPLVRGILAQLLTEMVRLKEKSPVPGGHDCMDPRIRRVLDWLSVRFREPVDLETAAELAALSPSWFCRLFHRHTHFSFVEYLSGLRIQEACRLLSSTERTAGEIAGLCGFGSITQFGRVFREITGQSPREYRRRGED